MPTRFTYGCRARAAVWLLIIVALVFPAAVDAQTCLRYQVNLQGFTTLGAPNAPQAQQNIAATHYVEVRDRGVTQNHQLDFAILPIHGGAPQQVGELLLMSNSAWAKNPGKAASRVDMGTLGMQNGNYVLQLDRGIGLGLPPPNAFAAPGFGNVPGGLGGLCYPGAPPELCRIASDSEILSTAFLTPVDGGAALAFSPDFSQIAGVVQVYGTVVDNLNITGYYEARWSGQLIGQYSCP